MNTDSAVARASASTNRESDGVSDVAEPVLRADPQFDESERRFRDMIDALPVAIYTTDAHGRLTHFNPAAVALSGRTPIIGTDEWCVSWKLYWPDGTPLPHDQCPMAIALKEGRALRGEEIVVERPDGSRVWCTPFPSALYDATGRIVGGINMLVDITERKEAEQRLRETEQRFSRFMQHLPGLAWIKDADGRYVYANEAAHEAFRRSPADLQGKSDWDLFAPETAAQFREHDRAALSAESGLRAVEILTDPDGVVHRSIVNRFTIPGGDGKPPMVGGIAIDITELKGAKEILRQSEEAFMALAETNARLAAVVEHSDDAIISKDLNGVITSWNAGAERLYGYTAQEAVGRSVTLIIPPDRIDEEPRVLERIRRGELVDHFETVRRRKDGTLVDVSLTVSSIRDGHGRIVGASKIARNITQSKQAAEMLRTANRRKDEFLAMLAHELRNPLAPIVISLENLRRLRRAEAVEEVVTPADEQRADQAATRADLRQRADAAMDVLQRQVSQMVRLVDDLLDAGRISSGKIELRRERLELSSIIRHAVDAARMFFERQRQELTLTLPEAPIYLNADSTRLAQIVGNLLNNASKFTARGGKIWLTVELENDATVALRVRDTGIGLAEDQIPRVFEMFTQVDTSLKRPMSGLGIGLSLVKTLAQLHGGSVAATSSGLGKGSEFIVRLPVLTESSAQTQSSAPLAPTTTKPLRVLIVDDNRDSTGMLAMLLASAGHETYTAHDGVAAITETARLRPDVVLLDIGLPKLNGYEAARRIRKAQAHAEVRPILVAVTGWGQEDDRRRSEEAGFDAHLVKPVDFVALGKLLTELERRRPKPL